MVRAWYLAASVKDKRLPNVTDPPEFLDIAKVGDKTGCLYFKLDPDNFENRLEEIKADRGYNYQDVIDIRKDKLPDYEEKLENFYTEHIHEDEEIRYCAEGSGYFDARDRDDRWIRIELNKGDLLILPAGIYHRFTLDQKNNYIKLLRLFCGVPVWKAYNRPAEEQPARQAYIKEISSRG